MMRLFSLFLIFQTCCMAGIPYLARSATGTFTPMRWSSSNLNLFVNPSTASSLSNAEVISEMQAAIGVWNSVSDASISLSLIQTATTPASSATPDFANHVSFSSGGQLNSGIIGLTLTTANSQTGEIVDADILFNKASFVFVTGNSNVSANQISLQGVATHEIGHLLGFDHSAIRTRVLKARTISEATMFPYYSDDQKSLSQDDIALFASTYPASTNRYSGTVTGRVLSGEFSGDSVSGAHVTLWNVLDRTIAISGISGLASNQGVLYDGTFRIQGVPQGNYEAFIEPFPIEVPNYASRQVQLEQDFTFLKRLSTNEKQTWLSKARNFSLEFWHDTRESALEDGDGANTAASFAMTPGGSASLQFITNFGSSNVELGGSELALDKTILYGNGKTGGADQNLSWTLGFFTARDASGFALTENISPRLQVRTSRASFAEYTSQGIDSQANTLCQTVSIASLNRTSPTTQAQPTFLAGSPIRYRFELYAPSLPDGIQRCLNKVEVYFDSSANGNELVKSAFLSIEKPQTDRSVVELIPDIIHGIKTSGTDIFGYAPNVYAAPATIRVQPRFSDGTSIEASPDLSTSRSFLLFQSDRPATVVTTAFEKDVNAAVPTFLATASFAGRANVSLRPFFDGVELPPLSVNFISASTSGSQFFVSQSRVHIGLPNITTPTVLVDLYPNFSDQTPVPFVLNPVHDMRLRVLSTETGQSVTGVSISTVIGPLILMSDGGLDAFPSPRLGASTSYFGSPFYRFTVSAGPNATKANIAAELLGENLTQRSEITFSYADPFKTEIRAQRQYLTLGSGDTTQIEILPRFEDGTPVNSDISELIRLNLSSPTNCHGVNSSLSSASGDSTTNGISVRPIAFSTGNTIILTAVLTALPQIGITTNCAILVRGRLQSNGFRDISNNAVVQLVDVNPTRLQVEIGNTAIEANGESQTEIRIIPIFPDGSIMGSSIDANRITVSASEGTLLRAEPANSGGTILVPAGKENVPTVNFEDGTYRLSLRSTNFSTTSQITVRIDNRLSLQTREVQFVGIGSADPQKTEVRISNPVLHANGLTQTRIVVRPRNTFGEVLFLPPQSILSIQTTQGVLAGPVTSSGDGTYVQLLRSVKSTISKTAVIQVVIDGEQIRPNETFTVTMLNFDMSRRITNLSYPASNQIDAYDIAILAQAIRNRQCTEFLKTDCRLDINLDQIVDEKDMQLLLSAYGESIP